jgi:hypothetical protein
MHLSFTSYHTLAVAAGSVVFIWLLSKLMHTGIQQVFYPRSLLILLTAATVLTLATMLHQYTYASGMNQVTVQGLPRGFYQTLKEESGAISKSFSIRYFTEDITCWLSVISVAWFVFKAAVNRS